MAKKNKESPGLDAATLRRVRENAGLSMRELSVRIGKHLSWCSKIESGAVKALGQEEALSICRELGLEPDAFGMTDASQRRFSGEKLDKAMRNMNLSAGSLAKLVGVAAANVYRWRDQGAQPTERNVELLAESLEVPRASFYVEEDASLTGKTTAQRRVPLEPMASDVLVRIPAKVWSRLRKTAEAFAGEPLPHCDVDLLRNLLF